MPELISQINARAVFSARGIDLAPGWWVGVTPSPGKRSGESDFDSGEGIPRKQQNIALALMIPLGMEMLDIVAQRPPQGACTTISLAERLR